MQPAPTLMILVADDDAVSSKVVRGMLERMGHAAHYAQDGRAALEATEATTYDLILMDCEMPAMDGFEATRLIRARERAGGHRAHIVALTGSVSFNDEQRCFEAGMDAYLAKPVKERHLRAVLDRLVDRAGAPSDESEAEPTDRP